MEHSNQESRHQEQLRPQQAVGENDPSSELTDFLDSGPQDEVDRQQYQGGGGDGEEIESVQALRALQMQLKMNI